MIGFSSYLQHSSMRFNDVLNEPEYLLDEFGVRVMNVWCVLSGSDG